MQDKKPSLRAVGYIRVSDPKQVDNTSPETQRKAIEAYAKANGYKLNKIYSDLGETARTTDNRDEFLAMRADAGHHKFDVLIVHRWDRLNRSVMDSSVVKALLRRDYGIKIFSCTEASEDENATAFLAEGVAALIAEWYSRDLSRKIKLSRVEIFDRGLYYGSRRPFGYNMKDLILTPHETEAPMLREMFELYATGEWSFKDLADLLNQRGFKTTVGNRVQKETTHQILKNRLYVGYISRAETSFTSNGNRVNGEKMEGKGVHPPLISQELFDKAQEIMGKRRHNVQANPKEWLHLLSGLCYCGECLNGAEPPDDLPINRWGKCYTYRDVRDFPPSKAFPEGRHYVYQYYRCKELHKAAKAGELDQQVIDFLLSEDLADRWRDNTLKVVIEGMETLNTEERIADIKATMSRIDDRWDLGFIVDRNEYIAKRQALQDELDALKPAREDAYERAMDLIHNFGKHWHDAEGDMHKQQELIQTVVERVYVENGKLSAIVMKPDQRFIFADNLVTEISGSPDRAITSPCLTV